MATCEMGMVTVITMCLLAVLVTQPLKHITFKYDFLLGLNMCLSIVRQPIFTPTHELNKNHKLMRGLILLLNAMILNGNFNFVIY